MTSTDPPDLHVWIGGSPCSGKSTVAQQLAALLGWSLYTCDDHWDDHVRRGTRSWEPVLIKLGDLPIEVRLRQGLEIQVADVFEAYREEFPLIRADLADATLPTVVEGAALLPDLLATAGVPASSAVWLVPTEEFQRAHYARRGWARNLLVGISDADDLFETWMRRDAAFGRLVALQARDLGYRVITVDGSASAESVFADVADGLSKAS
ncbi:MAG TPA: hypothetical protein VIM10_03565 [Actinopolymorphaceae bacterium]